MQQILLHPGFHRTGTSSMQHFLWVNRDLLAPYLTVRLTRHFKPLAQLCTRYAARQNPLDLTDLIGALDQGFAEFPVPRDRNLVISSEALCGDIPGHGTIKDYSAAPALITYLTGYLQDRFPEAEIKVILSTRAPENWLFSIYRHVLRRSRLTLTPEKFARDFTQAADLMGILAQIAEAIAPIETLYLPLEHALTSPLGPGGALLDQLHVPDDIRASLQPVGIGAAGASKHLWEEFLAINRSDLSNDEIAAQKELMAEAAKLGHWQKA